MINNKLIELFVNKLQVRNSNNIDTVKFMDSIIKYLQHSSTLDMSGRTYEFVNNKLDIFVNICLIIGISYDEMIHIITVFPQILNTMDNFYEKYLFLGLIEDENNTVRKSKLVNKPRDFAVSLQQIYSRYKLICESGYDRVSWNALVHATKKEFANIFVANSYYKHYQLFTNNEQVFDWLTKVDIQELDIDEYKLLDVNREIVEKYEKREKGLR